MKEWARYGHHFMPSLAVNQQTFRGSLTPHNVMEAICVGFQHPPRLCRKELKKDGIIDDDSGFMKVATLTFVVIIMAIVAAAVLFFYKRTLDKEM